MADYIGSEIKIGGLLVLTDDNFETFEALLQYVSDRPAEYGAIADRKISIENIEEHCRHLWLSYTRVTSPSGEYNGETVNWRPGMEEPHCVKSQDNGKRYLDEDDLSKVMDALNDGDSPPSYRIVNAKQLITDVLGLSIPALEPLKIIDNRTKKNG